MTDFVIVGIIILLAIVYVGYRISRRIKGKGDCGCGCGCDCKSRKSPCRQLGTGFFISLNHVSNYFGSAFT